MKTLNVEKLLRRLELDAVALGENNAAFTALRAVRLAVESSLEEPEVLKTIGPITSKEVEFYRSAMEAKAEKDAGKFKALSDLLVAFSANQELLKLSEKDPANGLEYKIALSVTRELREKRKAVLDLEQELAAEKADAKERYESLLKAKQIVSLDLEQARAHLVKLQAEVAQLKTELHSNTDDLLRELVALRAVASASQALHTLLKENSGGSDDWPIAIYGKDSETDEQLNGALNTLNEALKQYELIDI